MMLPASKQERFYLFAIALALLTAYFGFMHIIELRAEEPRRAIVSLEMLLSKNWIVPEINGWTYYNKPPLFNWLMAGFFALFGSASEWVVRLPALLSLLALAALNYKFSSPYIGKRTALYASLFLLTAADLLFYGTVNSGEIDLFYALLVYLQAMAIFRGFESRQYLKMFLLSYTWVALGFMTKGLPSLAFQVFTLLGAAIYYRRFWLLLSWKHLSGILLLFISCGTYLWLYHREDNAIAFLVRQFKEASQRTGLETDALDTLLQSLSFPLQFLALLLPWALLIAFFFRKGLLSVLKSNRLLSFASLFIVVNIPLYWFSGDFKPRYYYMFFPFVCVLLAHFYQIASGRSQKRLHYIFTALACLIPAALVYLYFLEDLDFIPYHNLIISIFILITLGLAYAQWSQNFKLLNMVLLMLVLRLALNFLYLPALQEHNEGMYYRDSMGELLAISGDEKIYLYGEPHRFLSDASLGPLTFNQVELTTAPLLAYQIPYYLSRANGEVVEFISRPRAGKLHIARQEDLPDQGETILFQFEDKWKHHQMVLFRFP